MLFSIVIATYNVESCVKRCLDSIADQKFRNAEVLVVDGKSRDLTVDVIAAHPVVSKWISEPDKGIYDAWNKGIALAQGQWIIFIGADDYLATNALDSLAEYCVSHDYLDFVSGKVSLVDERGRQLRTVGEKWNWAKFRREMNVAHPGAAHNRKLYNEVGFYGIKYKIVGDYELLLRKRASLNVGFVDTVLANMTVGGVSHMSRAALDERYAAKAEHNTVPVIFNFVSLYYGYVKLYIKIFLLKLGLVKV
ncbi:glycosyltransferase family 2 protein [Marinobacterium rhizophilum]|uniref:Glycosyltransferase n=1 Tax=Marinobacterium rhizophilum TaxID=420402 RepID=A0ABY5HRS0_9GAMM|nr:glycosyltransferase family 2 protein [Marinobacterium rhizophilum]UTW14253.1 glycosyltransferase [Marinobacterium rhizophilum]